ncbi:MAG: hypothetical protein ACRCYR_10610 [Phycicoccus sp.]
MDALTTTGLVVGAVALVLLAAASVLRRRRGDATGTSDVSTSDTVAEVQALVAQRQRVDAVRLYRARTGASLVDAARAVDDMAAHQRDR